jgi:hypothetical protein
LPVNQPARRKFPVAYGSAAASRTAGGLIQCLFLLFCLIIKPFPDLNIEKNPEPIKIQIKEAERAINI